MIQIRAYSPSDAPDMLELNRHVLKYYNLDAATDQEEQRLIALLDGRRHLSCELAYVDGRPAGFATWVLTFPAGTGTALYMKELFVAPGFQDQGVGKALMAHLARIARDEGCKRIDWQTDGDNAGAQAFYGAMGAPVIDKVSYRVTAADFDRFSR
ncbi:GNAT family N-acetyltransferase [Cognatiyoonia sp. IB215446]|uniref:GNAT family N-acetyltransferase n=1 Tax=Cognatiyoonia sp. IB215446 TaxID=3097355 RepID=UPI002A0DBC57|nr:GNAT family N-acetyltransferase [Cognatiyoonia sp. IB215446]MDX8347563.1 GNAT family N-acetyltransferase [Cognatiyoonia sp. IB215446]